ncbi:hypothetical protein [Thalassotalea profundi]|uniref:DUF4870 domain-containing protein n=1 Tax=Thalassotalea profundi TaxID=2036687 RepID=A0ABQ3IHH9_9GAMM|nr:hypothetical protein [Thalassotalea profundi]GHE83913.1 hypothetical protein GCM10011501_10750 [Thalassotalea profundi]
MDNNKEQKKRSAIIYQSLYLMNLLLIPGIAFFILVWQFSKNHKIKGWQRIHLFRSLQLSLISGGCLVLIPLLIVLFSDHFNSLLALLLVYFVTAHALFVLVGMLNLSRAMAKKLPLF